MILFLPVIALAALLPTPSLAADGAGLETELRRFRAELRADEPVLSPGIAARNNRETDRLERMADRDQAGRELGALERDLADQVTGLPGAASTLLGPRDGFPNVYAPADALASPRAWRLPETGGGWP